MIKMIVAISIIITLMFLPELICLCRIRHMNPQIEKLEKEEQLMWLKKYNTQKKRSL